MVGFAGEIDSIPCHGEKIIGPASQPITIEKKAPRLLFRIDSRVPQIEVKADSFVTAFQNLSVMIKNQQKQPSPMKGAPYGVKKTPSADNDGVWSFRLNQGHGANPCPASPHRDNRCSKCGKKRHSEAASWSRGTKESTEINISIAIEGSGNEGLESEEEKETISVVIGSDNEEFLAVKCNSLGSPP